MEPVDIKQLTQRVTNLRREAEALAEVNAGFPSVWRNALRILASVKMIEINLGLSQPLDSVEPVE